MIRLKKATIYKYKCVETTQSFDIEPDVTVLVGMNESGKTSLLEALAKVNYFEDDPVFAFNMIRDYPRKEKKLIDKSGVVPEAVKLDYEISEELQALITADIKEVFKQSDFSYTAKYNNSKLVGLNSKISFESFVGRILRSINIKDEKYKSILIEATSEKLFEQAMAKLRADGETAECLASLQTIKKYFINSGGWPNPIEEYIYRTHIRPNIPKFMYYDDYYALKSRISINKIDQGTMDEPSEKTAKALLELADINTKNIINAESFEDFKAELEATQAIISDELFKYWSTNRNLRIQFDIDKVEGTDQRNNQHIIDHVLDIRVQNLRSMVSLPLANRSKGFNWFFSFLVWFKKIQADKKSTYILLLDEPGLNLHAMAQHDLLRFIEDLSKDYQILYTTHSPFMIDSSKLSRVRTVLEKEDGTHISDSVQEKDPNTLFPLQAALGYTIAQNLYVSEKNLLVEGIADLVYLSVLSNLLKSLGKPSLPDDVTIVPVGGADKIATFVSLLRGNELNTVCLLDTFTDPSAKARVDNLVAQNLIKDKKVVFYHQITKSSFADVEDLFADEDYLKLYNGAFTKKIALKDIDQANPIMEQLKHLNGDKNFNHYTPANHLAKNITTITLSEETLDNFSRLFELLNKKF